MTIFVLIFTFNKRLLMNPRQHWLMFSLVLKQIRNYNTKFNVQHILEVETTKTERKSNSLSIEKNINKTT